MCSILEQLQCSTPKLEKESGSERDREDGRQKRSTNHKAGRMFSAHFGTGDRVRVVFDESTS